MKIKKEYILLLAVIIGLSVYLYVNDRDRINYELPDIPAIEESAVDRVEITVPDGDSVVLKKKDNTWRMMPEGYPADENKISSMLKAATDLTLTALVSESTDYQRYDLSDEDAIMISLFDKDGILLRQFAVGKKAGSTNHTFIRLADNPAVYHARGSLNSTFDKTVSSLRDKTVLAFAKSDVQAIEIKMGADTIPLEKKTIPAKTDDAQSEPEDAGKTEWLAPDGRQGDVDAINALLDATWSLDCKSYISDRKEAELGTPIYTLTIKTQKDQTLSLFSPEAEGDGDYPAVSTRAMTPFFLPKSKATQIIKDPTDLLTDVTEK
ncbi:MAG: DUF4340 domain-containing protein [Thermodesulfobacteriota bacterium]|nr:DUF4340 domain-containing protein [Thermodesulfobacteriota bacterium]